MEVLRTSRIHIRVKYDLESMKTTGKVYSEIEKEGEDMYVGDVTEEVAGTGTLHILQQFKDKQYIKEDFELLKPEFASIANMWAAKREYTNIKTKRGIISKVLKK
ncbi:MAG: hypothetical protein HFJ42_00150 [Clostridia bacterium]|nr:hypothetical protein [Clostridia bacterium]